jgi:transcriptional regulator with XRE-family HTH domain
MSGTIKRPLIKSVDFCVDENIWGHRLYDEQLPHLTVLEFLGVLGSNLDKPLRPHEGLGGAIQFKPQRQIRLRGLLFNNPYVESIAESKLADDEKWRQWLSKFEQGSTGNGDGAADLAYLRQSFNSFEDFAKAIELLRSSSFESRSNKRWSSKFVFPFGPDALYEDIQIDAKGNISNDRRFFARTGELLYLMLARASRGAELGDLLAKRLFERSAPMNRLARALQGPPQLPEEARQSGYLPETSNPRFDQMCEDWLAILSRDMPVYDALEHLISITGLNMLLYFLERAKRIAGDDEPVEFVCEIVSKDGRKVRALSGDSYQANQGSPEKAVRAHVESIRSQQAWIEAGSAEFPDAERMKLLREAFQWPQGDEKDDEGYASRKLDELVSKLVELALQRHGQHVGKIHAAWSRAIGLSSRRLSRRYRYAPNDRLLKSIVIAIVGDRMQFDEFLAEAKRRYGLIIGDAEGARLVEAKTIDQAELSENRDNLEARLVGLGLVRRLSDSCSFVENPFVSELEAAC